MIIKKMTQWYFISNAICVPPTEALKKLQWVWSASAVVALAHAPPSRLRPHKSPMGSYAVSLTKKMMI